MQHHAAGLGPPADGGWSSTRSLRYLIGAFSLLTAPGCSGDDAAEAVVGVHCEADEDCAGLDDGDACNGTLRCDGETHRCRLDRSAVKPCDASQDSACSHSRCDPSTGKCALTARQQGGPCDDGDPCTVGDRCDAGTCLAGVASLCTCKSDGDCPDDGDLCNGTRHCDRGALPWTCRTLPGSAKTCDTAGDSACKQTTCDPKTGACSASLAPADTPCDDGDPCTSGEACAQGTCTGGGNTCVCQSDKDCASKEDGDLCNGTLYCDKSARDEGGKTTPACKVNPATVVSCNSGKDTACAKAACDPGTGTCALTPVPGGTSCSDDDACTEGDACFNGVCMAGTNTCVCTSDAECEATKGDGDLCNGTLFCNKVNGTCQPNPATVVTCPSGKDTACAVNTCVHQAGSGGAPATTTCALKPAPDTTACDDGDLCTAGDVCKAGTCTAGTDVCLCKTDADCLKQDDGDLCNGVPFCDKSLGKCKPNPASKVTCPTVGDTDCRKQLCAPTSGKCQWQLSADGSPCSDGAACTTNDFCVAGKCAAGTYTCACKVDADCPDKDGDACNGVPFCDLSGTTPACKPNPASVVYCSPKADTACLKSTCQPLTGVCALAPVQPGTTCDDGDPCTTATSCQGATCQGGQAAACDDSNPCTTDACTTAKGCTHALKTCDDGNDCSLDGCDTTTGKCKTGLKPKGALCNGDNNGCSLNDSCDGKGTCVIGKAVSCLGAVAACHALACKTKGTGDFTCVPVQQPDDTVCDAKGACQVGATCKAGTCGGATKPTLFTQKIGPVDGITRLLGVVAVGASDAVVVGQVRAKANAAASTDVGLIRRVDATGKTVWEQPFVGKGALAGTRATVVQATPDGALLIGGAAQGGDGSLDLQIERRTAAGKLVWTTQVAGFGDDRVEALAVAPDGSIAALGHGVASKTLKTLEVRLTASGAVVSKKLGFEKDVDLLQHYRSAQFASGGDLLVGSAGRSLAQSNAWHVTRVDAQGQSEWHQAGYWGVQSLGGRPTAGLAAAFPLANDEVLAVAWQPRPLGSTPAMSAVRIASDGSIRWQHVGRDNVFPRSAARGESGRFVVLAHDSTDLAKPQARLVSVDVFGNEQWSRAWTMGGRDEPTGVAILGDGAVAAVGYTSPSATAKTAQGWLIRTTPWGSDSCSKTGLCADKGWSQCDDGVACTADDCAPAIGCVHSVPKAARCSPANGCSQEALCLGTTCQPSHNGAVYVKPLGTWGSSVGVSRMHGFKSVDGQLAWMLKFPKSAYTGWWTTSKHFEIDKQGSVQPCSSGAWVDGDFLAKNAARWSVWHEGAGVSARARVCRSYPALVSVALPTCTGCGMQPVDVAATPENGAWVLSQYAGAALGPLVSRVAATGKQGATVPLEPCGDGVCDPGEASVCLKDCAKKAPGSCGQRCGSYDAKASCQCDANCAGAKDCCADRAKVCTASSTTDAVAVQSLPDASAAVLLASGAASVRVARVVVVDVAGKQLWAKTLSLKGAVDPRGLATDSAGNIVAVGRHRPNQAVFAPFHAKLTSKGAVAWVASVEPADLGEADAALVEADGGLVLSGWRMDGSAKRVALWRTDAKGALLWSRTLQPVGADVIIPSPGALTRLGTDYFVGASTVIANKANLAMVRTNAAGFASCVTAGKCLGKAALCDDSNAATADYCHPTLGCVHKP